MGIDNGEEVTRLQIEISPLVQTSVIWKFVTCDVWPVLIMKWGIRVINKFNEKNLSFFVVVQNPQKKKKRINFWIYHLFGEND